MPGIKPRMTKDVMTDQGNKGAGHTQRKVINNSLPQALEYVWLDYTPLR